MSRVYKARGFRSGALLQAISCTSVFLSCIRVSAFITIRRYQEQAKSKTQFKIKTAEKVDKLQGVSTKLEQNPATHLHDNNTDQ